MRHGRITAIALTVVMTLVCSAELLAKPPPWAPAHGYRAKNDPFYVGYAGHQWNRDYGILGGRCNTDEILAVTGAVAGGVIGGRVAKPEDRVVATILGAVIGGVIGNAIGDRLDERDRACIGHSLELARTGQTVRWTNPKSGFSYQVTPVRDHADGCREFQLVRKGRDPTEPALLRSCSRDTGTWTLL